MAYIDDPQTQRANLKYIRASMREPLLEREREFELAERWRRDEDEDALHQLVRAYARLVVSTASRFRNYGLPIGDLVQEGNIGLLQAAAKFDPEREVRFSTYASWWIRSAIQDYILRNWSIVRTGTTAAQKTLFFNLRRLRAQIGDSPTGRLNDSGRQKIAKELQVKFSEVESMENRMSAGDHSLNAMVADGSEESWQDFLADTRPTPEDILTEQWDHEVGLSCLNEALAALSPREQKIIRQRRLQDEGATLEELGRELGVSKERVRQLEHRALSKMRDSISRIIERPADLLVDA
jgi:RNA polymerase sigma-32 factor